jgi:hypothetical protein
MARTYTTKRRSYSDINREAKRARELGNLRDSIDFCINDFIDGPLRDSCKGRLATHVIPATRMAEPAKVDLSKKFSSINLYVREDIWSDSKAKLASPRFILAPETGHICLHKDDNFDFSPYNEDDDRFIEREYFVEDQANNFADIFLLSEGAVSGFSSMNELVDYCDFYCGVPDDTIKRRFELVARSKSHHFGPKYDLSRLCSKCGSHRVLEILNYQKCDDCSNVNY